MNINWLITALICLNLNSYAATANEKPGNPGKPMVAPEVILKGGQSLLVYDRDYLRLGENFTGYDQHLKLIKKEQFLKLLTTGYYLPLRLTTTDFSLSYQLYKIPAAKTKENSIIIQQWGKQYYDYYKREGLPLPAYNFVDLNGKQYNSKTTKGKFLLLKTWFITCHACVEEMPALNAKLKEYQNRQDILFVSLAWDGKKELNSFLKTHPLSYAVVPGQEPYVSKSLKLNLYPTHLLVDKKGLVVKVGSAKEIFKELENQIALEKTKPGSQTQAGFFK